MRVGVVNYQYVALEKVLTEIGQEEYFFPRVGEHAVGLQCRRVARVKEMVYIRRGFRRRYFRRNDESVGRARRKDYPMGCWREAAPTARLPVGFAFFRNDRAEGICVLQPRGYFAEDSCESGVILGYSVVLGFLPFQVAVLPLAELACRALVLSQG